MGMVNKIINSLIIKIISFLPIPIVKLFAKRYVAGETSDEALDAASKLNEKGYSVTLDILGEHTKSKAEAESITSNYARIYDKIYKLELDCNISIKPSHIGLDVSIKTIKENLDILVAKANETNNFLRIDMESSKSTDVTLDLFKEYYKNNSNIGTVLQAYLYRTKHDIEHLISQFTFNFRLCKGIYKESDNIAIQNRNDINSNYLDLLKIAFDNNIYVGIATHDTLLIQSIYKLINKMNISSDKFEFQVLYGVPMSGWNEKHLQNGYKVRVYVPFGSDWYPYSIRRLKENPNIAKYIIKNLIRK